MVLHLAPLNSHSGVLKIGNIMKKVLIISSRTYPAIGGVENVVDNLASGLSSKFKVKVITNFYRTQKPGLSSLREFLRHPILEHIRALIGIGYSRNGYTILESYFIFFGISKIRNILSLLLFPITVLHFIYHLWLFRPDIVNLHFADNSTVYAWLAKKLLPKSKLVISFHGVDLMKFASNSKIHSYIVTQTALISDHVVFVSRNLEEYFKKIVNTREIQVAQSIIYNAVGTLFTHKDIRNKEGSYILFLGRLVAKKGVDILIRAYNELTVQSKSNIPNLVIVGDGDRKDELVKMADGNNKIEFRKSATIPDEVIEYMDDAIMFITPSREEPFGIVNIEAMSRDVPVIASNVGGIPEYITDNQTGLLFESENVGELNHCIVSLLNDSDLRAKLAKGGRKLVNEGFSSNIFLSKYEELYNNL